VSEGPWPITFTRRADRDMERLDQPIRQRVATALDTLAEDPHSGKLSRLTGRPESKLRVGDWRILVTLDEKAKTIQVIRVLPRGRAYDR
jgi:mRNA interferase RelE/StbE